MAFAQSPAHAQNAAENDLAEGGEPVSSRSNADFGAIVVTAQRRAENVQDLPIAVQAIGAEQIKQAGIDDIADIAKVAPGLVFSQVGTYPSVSLRGISTELTQIAGESSVALSLNGVPLLRQRYLLGALFDVERIEVLRGPQGTIAGRSATGGAVNIIQRRPTFETEGRLSVSYGNFDAFTAGISASGAVIPDVLAARIAVERRSSDGYIRSTLNNQHYGGSDDILARASLLFAPSDGAEFILSGDYFESDDISPPYVGFGIGSPGVTTVISPANYGNEDYFDPETNRADIFGLGPSVREIFKAKSFGVSLSSEIELGPDTVLKTVTGYREAKGNELYEGSRTNVAIVSLHTPNDQHQFTQEVTLTSSFGDSIDILIGGQYIDETAKEDTSLEFFEGLGGPVYNPPLGVNLTSYDRIDLESYALFGQVQWRIVPDLQLTLGGRYTHDQKAYTGKLGMPAGAPPMEALTLEQKASWDAFTPRVAIDWQASDEVLLYASVAKGFKGGGFATSGPLLPSHDPFSPETVWSYEAGLKSEWFDRRLRFNLTGFWADYRDLQYPFFIAPATIIQNAGKARARGFELELSAEPVDRWQLGLNATYLDAEYRDFVAADPSRPPTNIFGVPVPGVDQVPTQRRGNRLSKAPELSLTANTSYSVPVSEGAELTLYGDVSYQSKTYFSPFENSYEMQEGYALVNLSAELEFANGFSITAFGRNIFDKQYLLHRLSQSINLAGVDPRLPADPNNPLAQVVSASSNMAVVGEPRTYGVTLAYEF